MGTALTPTGVNFAVFSRNAAGVTICLFPPEPEGNDIQIHLNPEKNRTGDIWHIHLDRFPRDWSYGWRIDGPYDPEGIGHRFNWNKLLIDPYAKALTGNFVWDSPTLLGYKFGGDDLSFNRENSAPYVPKCVVIDDSFDWEEDRPPRIPLKDSIIYEVSDNIICIYPCWEYKEKELIDYVLMISPDGFVLHEIDYDKNLIKLKKKITETEWLSEQVKKQNEKTGGYSGIIYIINPNASGSTIHLEKE